MFICMNMHMVTWASKNHYKLYMEIPLDEDVFHGKNIGRY